MSGAAYRSFDAPERTQFSAAPAATHPPRTGVAGDSGNGVPTPLATATTPPKPTAYVTADPSLNDCPNHPQEGALCRMPVLTPAATVVPDCPVEPGRWCRQKVIGTTGRTETR